MDLTLQGADLEMHLPRDWGCSVLGFGVGQNRGSRRYFEQDWLRLLCSRQVVKPSITFLFVSSAVQSDPSQHHASLQKGILTSGWLFARPRGHQWAETLPPLTTNSPWQCPLWSQDYCRVFWDVNVSLTTSALWSRSCLAWDCVVNTPKNTIYMLKKSIIAAPAAYI